MCVRSQDAAATAKAVAAAVEKLESELHKQLEDFYVDMNQNTFKVTPVGAAVCILVIRSGPRSDGFVCVCVGSDDGAIAGNEYVCVGVGGSAVLSVIFFVYVHFDVCACTSVRGYAYCACGCAGHASVLTRDPQTHGLELQRPQTRPGFEQMSALSRDRIAVHRR